MARTAVAIDHQYNLIEDYAHTRLPALAEDISAAFVTLHKDSPANPSLGETELLSVSDRNALMHFYHDTASPSGWNHEERSVDGSQNAAIDKLLGFYRGTALYALAHYAAEDSAQKIIGMRKVPGKGWMGIPMQGQLDSFIARMTQTDTFTTRDGRIFVYGVSTAVSPGAFVLIEVSEEIEDWSLLYTEMIPAAGVGYRLLPGAGEDVLTVMTLQGTNATFRGASISNSVFSWNTAQNAEHDLGLGTLSARQVFALSAHDGSSSFLLQGTDGSLSHIGDYWQAAPKIAKMTGSGTDQPAAVKQVSTGQDAAGRWMVFATQTGATSGEDSLWLLRESSATDQGVGFDAWAELGGAQSSIACPRQMSDGPEVFVYDLQSTVCNLVQSTASTAWYTETLAVPETEQDATPPEAPSYNHEITALDIKGNPVGGQVLTLRTDRPATVAVNGIVHKVGPNTPLDVQTDNSGELALHTVATGLSAPAVTLDAAWLEGGTTGPLRADSRVHARLAGQDPDHPVDGDTLKQAQLLPQDASDDVAKASADKLKSFGAVAVQIGNGGSTDAPPLVFAMIFSEDGLPEIVDADPATFERDHVLQSALSIGSIFGDIVHFLKNALGKLKSIAVKLEQDVAHIVINGISHIVKTVEGVASAIELVVKKIASAVKSVVDAVIEAVKFLMELLHWDDIIHCKQVLSHYVDSTLTQAAKLAGSKAPQLVQKGFDKAKADIVTLFNNLEKDFEKGVSFNDQVPKSSNKAFGGGGTTLDATNMHSYHKQNKVQMNYVKNRSKGPVNAKVGGGAMALGAGGGVDIFDQIEDAIEKAFDKKTRDDLEDSLKKMQDWLADIDSPKTFFDVVVLDFLELVKDAVLTILSLIEAVILTLLDLAADAIVAVQALLDDPIDIPVISWLYKKIACHSLTILDVMCLVVAVPATLIYKVFYGGSDASPPFTEAQASKIENAPVPWPAILSETGDTGTAPAAKAPLDDDLLEAMALIGCVTWVIFGLFEVVLDSEAASEGGDEEAEEDDTRYLQLAAMTAEVITQAVALPSIAATEDEETANWLVGQWGTAFVPFLLDVVSYKARDKITRFNEGPGLLADFLAGGLLLGVSAGALQTGKNKGTINTAGQVALLLPAFPLLFKPLIADGDDPLSLAPLLVADLGGDWGTGIAGAVSAAK